MKHRPIAAALAGVALIGGCATPASDGPSTEPSGSRRVDSSADPSPTSSWETFTSDRFGYSIGHPSDWEIREQVGEVSLQGLRPRHPGTDNIATPDSHQQGLRDGVVMIAVRDLQEEESLTEFTRAADEATTCGPPFGYDDVTLGGEPAEYSKFECATTFWVQVTAVHDGRGYLLWLISTTPPKADRRPINDQFLATFAFTD